jgi:ribose/xylose/arabinose/galactoside ABC-type transport system permease subunit
MKKILARALPVILIGLSSVYVTSAVCVQGTIGGVPTMIGDTCGANGSQLVGLINTAQVVATKLVPLLLTLGLLSLFWFLINFIWLAKDDPKKQQDSIKGMTYSILALFVMVSIWGIIYLIGSVLGIGQGGEINTIQLPRSR